jgi:hypothetical protein
MHAQLDRRKEKSISQKTHGKEKTPKEEKKERI